MKSYQLLHMMGDLIIHAPKIPFTQFAIFNENKLLDLLEECEGSLPEELRKANEVMEQQVRILEVARKEADEILERARAQAKALVADHEIVSAAHQEAEKVRQDASAELQRNQAMADRYADDTLAELEGRIARALTTVQNGRGQLSGS
jgi:vacuolar-type H+-ATPase subunit H